MAKGGLLFEIRQGVSVRSLDTEGATPENPIPTLERFFFFFRVLGTAPRTGAATWRQEKIAPESWQSTWRIGDEYGIHTDQITVILGILCDRNSLRSKHLESAHLDNLFCLHDTQEKVGLG